MLMEKRQNTEENSPPNAFRFIHLFCLTTSRRLLDLKNFFFFSISKRRNNRRPRKVKWIPEDSMSGK